MNPILSIRQVSKSFGTTSVLKEINLDLREGEFLTLLGPSGCGKTTLLRCIAGLETWDQGEITLDGRDLAGLALKDRGIGMVFQHYALFPTLNVLDNVMFGLRSQGMALPQARTKALETLDMVRLADKAKALPFQLSGGQQQRVALARALVLRPRILLLDEPLSALDAQIRRTLRAELRDLQRSLGMTMILVTHDQEEAFAVSDRLCLMHRGRILQEGSPQDIYSSPRHEHTARFLGNYNVMTSADLGAWTWQSHPAQVLPELPATGAVAPEELDLDALGCPDGSGDESCREAASDLKPVSGALWTTGVIEDASPLGGIRRYRVRLDSPLAQASQVVVDQLNSSRRPWLDCGTPVRVVLKPASIRHLIGENENVMEIQKQGVLS